MIRIDLTQIMMAMGVSHTRPVSDPNRLFRVLVVTLLLIIFGLLLESRNIKTNNLVPTIPTIENEKMQHTDTKQNYIDIKQI